MRQIKLAPETYDSLTDQVAVAANRRGELTAEQRARLERATDAPAWPALVLLLCGLALLLPTVGALSLYNHGRLTGVGVGCTAPCALVGVYCLGVVVFFPFTSRRRKAGYTAALRHGEISQAEGEVRGPSPAGRAFVNGRRLRLVRAMNVPLPLGRYRFYYLPATRTLLSAEPLSQETSGYRT